MKKTLIILPSIFLIFNAVVYFGNDLLRHFENDKPSQSIGTTKDGKLVNGKRLPTKGKNFVTCSRLSCLLGRNSVNNLVQEAILESYDSVFKLVPQITFVYGETSWPHGGRLWPHKTHENGLSVDFFVPVKNKNGKPVAFPTSVLNEFGYGVAFDSLGSNENLTIDFEAMAMHLYCLGKAANHQGLKIEVVIFDNQLQTLLLNTKYGQMIKDSMRFSTLKPWVRHDQHYHVDFAVL